MFMRSLPCLLSLSIAATLSPGQPVTLTIIEQESSVSGDMCVTPVLLGERCDQFDSPLAGSFSIRIDDPDAPSAIVVSDFDIAFTQNLELAFSWSILGSLSVTLNNAGAAHASPGTPTPLATVDAGGGFLIPAVPTQLRGSGSAIGSLAGQPVDQSIDLAAEPPVQASFTGTLSIQDGIARIEVSIPIAETVEDPVATVVVTGVMTAVAEGPVPCAADFNSDGATDFFDVAAFLGSYAAAESDADINLDGVLDFFDVAAFLSNYNAGCP